MDFTFWNVPFFRRHPTRLGCLLATLCCVISFFSPILCYDLVVFCTAFSLAGKSAYPKKGVGQNGPEFAFLLLFLSEGSRVELDF